MFDDYMTHDYDDYMTHDYDDNENHHDVMPDGFYWANCGDLDEQLESCTARAEVVNGEIVDCRVQASSMGMTFSETCEVMSEQAGVEFMDVVHMLEWNYDGATDYFASGDSDYDYMMGDNTHDDNENHHDVMPDGFYWANCGDLDEQLEACTARAEVVNGEVVECNVQASAMGFTFSESCEVMSQEAGVEFTDVVQMLEWNYDGATDYHASDDSDYDYLMSTRSRRGRRHN
jgi:uncharacterized ParB-like nuclease family protein